MKLYTLCCGTSKAKDVIIPKLKINEVFCLKCNKSTILVSEEEYNMLKRKDI
jgi:hypothetical protein